MKIFLLNLFHKWHTPEIEERFLYELIKPINLKRLRVKKLITQNKVG
jgi:hypothetical protein